VKSTEHKEYARKRDGLSGLTKKRDWRINLVTGAREALSSRVLSLSDVCARWRGERESRWNMEDALIAKPEPESADIESSKNRPSGAAGIVLPFVSRASHSGTHPQQRLPRLIEGDRWFWIALIRDRDSPAGAF
jgi:hypothetical protein